MLVEWRGWVGGELDTIQFGTKHMDYNQELILY